MNKNFWAKKNESKGKKEWLPLYIHLEDTKNIINRLWYHWLSPGQKDILIEATDSFTEEEAIRLVEFVGASHDIAKATPAFQMMEGFRNSPDLDDILKEKLVWNKLLEIDSKVPINREKSHHSLAGYILLKNFGVNEDIASIIGAHHGSLILNNMDESQLIAYPSNYYLNQNEDDPTRQRWDNEQRKIFNWALKSSGYDNVEELPSISQPAQVILSGLLIMADWIASNENYFPLIDIEENKVEDINERAKTGWAKWFNSHPWEPSNYSENLYYERFGFKEPRDVQKKFAEIVEDIYDPGIIILEAPMGLGKTEAALVGAEILARNLGMSGIFFGLPTQATSDGMFPRIKEWLETIVDEEKEDFSLRLSHGKSALNKEFTSLAKNIDIDSSSDRQRGSVITNEWFSGRKTSSLDDFVVGTVDYFLLNSLKQKHLALRHLGFSKKVVIIDEVHAYDAYMNQYLYQSLRWMGAYNVPVIILSATLPAEKREEMVIEYLRGKNIKKRDMIFPKEGLKTTAYPLITYNDGEEIKQETKFEEEEDKSVEIIRLEEENLEEIIMESVNDGANIALIVNTVRRAQEMGEKYKLLLGKDKVDILHSSFIATDRIEKEKKLLNEIGKGVKRPDGKLIIGTQVIEQSLDIDFDLMISDLAPMDLLIQRIGRLHRHHGTKRPEGYEKPKLYVLGTDDKLEFEDGSLAVYGGYLLTRTQYYLPDIINLPSDISPLVQYVYGNEEIKLDKNLTTLYNEMKEDHEREIENKKIKAGAFKLSNPSYKNRRGQSKSLVNWVDMQIDFESDERAYAQVRDIEETVEVIALKRIGEGYGIFGTDMDISEEINYPETARKIAKETIRLPIRYGLGEIIEFLEEENKKELNDWQRQSWLKGSLGVIFDENNEYKLNNYILKYDEDFGLKYERE